MQASYNIAQTLTDQARKHPYQPAVLEPSGRDKKGRRSYSQLSYQVLDQQSTLIAKALIAYGLPRGCRTVLMVPPSLDFFALTFGLFKAGAVPVFVDPGLGLKRIKQCLHEAQPTAFVGIAKAHIARRVLGWGKPHLKHFISASSSGIGGTSLDKIIATFQRTQKEVHIPALLPDDPAAILFTSGSTGSPKGAIYTHGNFRAQIEALRSAYQIKQGEIDLCTFPLFALFAPALGMSAVIPKMNFTKPGSVDPKEIFEPIELFGVHNLFGSPALIRRISQDAKKRELSFTSLKRVVSAGAPVPAEVISGFRQALSEDASFHTPYGATEALPVASMESQGILQETAQLTNEGKGICIGYVVANTEVKIIPISDEPIAKFDDTKALPSGELGEIVVCGPQVTRRYHNRDEATSLAKISDGDRIWHRMGDLGYFDQNGRLWFCGRKTHRVVGKEQVWYTIPCEAVFNQHPAIFRTALVGIGKKGQQQPLICIETHRPKLSATERQDIITELQSWAERFEHTRGISQFLFHPKFPVDIRHNSKIFREQLAAWVEGKLR